MKKSIYLVLILLACFACKKEDNAPVEENRAGEFTDSRDGNVYKWVKIGNQVWMAENLAYLPRINYPMSSSETEPRYYVYGYEYDHLNPPSLSEALAVDNYSKYGVLYNWQAAMVACPEGWHLPSLEEWRQLAEYIQTQTGASRSTEVTGLNIGPYLKATSGWENGGNGTDDFGFCGLAAGYCDSGNHFAFLGMYSRWWTADHLGQQFAKNLRLDDDDVFLMEEDNDLDYGFSVRCVKDTETTDDL
ncbi:MAG: hypothetical protein JXR34_09870 [Bacteroidales bacterium]|nr:hypothetical protein [Bacteroidales bacterium]